MNHRTTSPSLLLRVRNPQDEGAWREFQARYEALLTRYCHRRNLQTADTEDVKQLVYLRLAKGLRNFEYDPKRGRFRDYLGKVVRSAMSRHFARPNPGGIALDTTLKAILPGDDGQAQSIWEQEWIDHHYRLAMQSIHATFAEQSTRVFNRLLAGESVAVVARTSDLSEQAVHKIKQRIKARLRELIAAQIREEDEPMATVHLET